MEGKKKEGVDEHFFQVIKYVIYPELVDVKYRATYCELSNVGNEQR